MRTTEQSRFAWACRRGALALAACAAFLPFFASAAEPVAAEADLRALLPELRKGGYVIYMRHATTAQVGATDEAADLARCETQRQLSDAGRAQASAIGKAVKALGIPVGEVQSSPFCRATETAQIAFGKHKVNNDLVFVMNSSAAEGTRLADALRRMLATAPRKGTNTILISHSANLREAAGIFAKPEGAAYVFRPLPRGGFEAVGRILPEEWAAAERRHKGP
jgi:phosphohistidine phosphatase SixA